MIAHRIALRRIASFALAVVCWNGGGSARGFEPDLADPDVAVQQGREALDRFSDYPWYDDSTDSIRRIEVRIPKPSRPTPVNNAGTGGSGGGGSWDWPRLLSWLFVGILLAALVFVLIRVYLNRERRPAFEDEDESADAAARHAARIEALPIHLGSGRVDLLAMAREHYAAGRYDRSVIYLYSWTLVELDRAHMLRLTKGKTNRQYLREVLGRDDLHRPLVQLIAAFESTFFGRHPVSQTACDRCWQSHAEIEAALGAVAV